MIINHSRSFIFVHVPKAAGTSLTRMLQGFTTYRDQEVGGTPFGEKIQPFMKKRFGLAKHASAEEIRTVMGPDDFHAYYSFAFVRNPYTRAFSIYNYFKRQFADKGESIYGEIARFATFSEFVHSDYFQTDGSDRIFRPQTFWVELEGEDQLSFVGSVEHIEPDMAKVFKRITGKRLVAGKGEKAHRNKPLVREENRSTHDSDALWEILRDDPSCEKVLFRRYESDFDLFAYRRFKPAAKLAYNPARASDA